jgi:hypothetical protein
MSADLNASGHPKLRQYIGSYFLFPLLLSVWCLTASPAGAEHTFRSLTTEDRAAFIQSWKEFQTAALDAPARLPALVRLPLQMHGILDDDPHKQCGADRLLRAWPKVLQEEVFVLDKHGRLVELTLGDFLRQNAVPSAEMIVEAGEKRLGVGDFVFVKDGGLWKLERIYTDTYAIDCPNAQ